MKRAFEIGVQFFLFKPVERNKLLKLIRVAEHSIEQERRRFTRVPLQPPVSLQANDKQLEGVTVDISFDGMLVQSHLVFPAGTDVKISLHLQNGSNPCSSKPAPSEPWEQSGWLSSSKAGTHPNAIDCSNSSCPSFFQPHDSPASRPLVGQLHYELFLDDLRIS